MRSRRARAAVAVSVALLQLATIGGARAADPPVPGPLDRPIADLAVVEDAATPGAPPILLTLDTIDLTAGSVRATLMQRSTAWQTLGATTIALLGPEDAPETPWLVEIAPGQFVILATSHQAGATVIAPIRVDSASEPRLLVGEPIRLPIAVDDAGAIDVEGDGSMELVVSSAATERGGDVCQGSVIKVLDGTTLSERAEWAVPDMRLAGGALDDLDGTLGGDLVAYAYGNCPAGPDAAQRLGVYALRLGDGEAIVSILPEDPAASSPAPGIPLVADLDGDGHDEVVIRDGATLAILDPAHGWARTLVARGDVMPILAAPSATDDAGTLVWYEHSDAGDGLQVQVGKVSRAADGSLVTSTEGIDLVTIPRARRGRVVRSIQDAAIAQAPPQAWRGDIDNDGCPRILAPLLTTGCGTRPDATLKIGATWFATRPIVAFDEAGGSRELLVAATMEWVPGSEPRAATPAAVMAPGAWRHGPSPRFAMSEVRAADAGYFGLFPVPRPTIERVDVRGQATDFPGFTGARVLLRVIALRADDASPTTTPPLDQFLATPQAAGERVTVERIPVPDGAESGRDGSFVHVSLADVLAPDGGPAGRWIVTIAQINDWGEIAGPVRGTIVHDISGPSLAVEIPFLSAPWPFAATVHGRSEPGVEIRGGSGGPVVADRRGRFELTTQLAPWPQNVELTAIDESGNATTRQYSLIGGIDYRSLPWPAILAAALLVAAFVSTGRATPRVRKVDWQTDSEPLPEIEELPSARQLPRT